MHYGPIFVDVKGLALRPEEADMLRHPNVGGLTLFARNYESREQLQCLMAEIRATRPGLLVAVDHEGGCVQRFREGFTRIPPMADLGRWYEASPQEALDAAKLMGWLMASELRSVDIDFSYAPVLDVNDGRSTVLRDRAFHHRPQVVADLASALVTGLREGGCAAVGKHFPGHGGVVEDTHSETATDQRSYDEILCHDLTPFLRLIGEGIEGIMPAHVVYAAIDQRPAAGSVRWLKGILRQRLKFKGVVFSDDMSMAAAAALGDARQRTEAALDAGCDVVLLCNDHEACEQVLSQMPPRVDTEAVQRLALMRGRNKVTWESLKADPRWQQAQAAVAKAGEAFAAA